MKNCLYSQSVRVGCCLHRKPPELQDDIRDDEFLFDEDQLTERERAERRYKKTVLTLALEHSKAGEIEKVQPFFYGKFQAQTLTT